MAEGRNERPDSVAEVAARLLLAEWVVASLGAQAAPAMKAFGALIRHDGAAHAYALGGTFDLYTDLYAPTRLHTGDSIYLALYPLDIEE